MGPRAGLDDVEKRNFLALPGLELQPVARLRYRGSCIAGNILNRQSLAADNRWSSSFSFCGSLQVAIKKNNI
jgi:hypothetical protein